MAEVCYSRGKKIILTPSQNTHGNWICHCSIPGLMDFDIGIPHAASPREYDTQREATTAAFKFAKRVLDASDEVKRASNPGGAK